MFTHLNEEVFLTTFRSILFAAVCLAVLFAPSASAQTQPYTISTYQGNGQMICSGCGQGGGFQYFDPIVAKVVDANLLPVAGVPVTWYLAVGNGYLGTFNTVTLSDGTTTNTYWSNAVLGSPADPFVSNQIVATIGNSYTTFYETQVLAMAGGTYIASVSQYNNTFFPLSLSGVAGTTATAPIQISAFSYAMAIPGVEVRLIPAQTSPSLSCAPAGSLIGDPGTVLTDTNGIATCNAIFAGSGTGTFMVLVGGVPSWTLNPGTPAGFRSFDYNTLTVTAPSPASIQATGGTGQAATAGLPIANPLTAVVKDTNGNALAGQAVTWSVSPASAGTFTNKSNTSDNNGNVQTGFTFSSTAGGTVTITVAISGYSAITPATFSLTAISSVILASFTKSSGDLQTTTSGQPFPNPLVVQVTTSSGSASGITVNFTATGGATVPATANTNSAGQANVTVTAPITTNQETVTVTASVGGLPSVTFSLTVNPAGPTLSASGFVNAADQKLGSLSPCSLATVIGSGIAPSISGTTVGASFGPGPLALAGASLTVSGTQAPIFSIANIGGTQSLTFQVPCEVVAPSTATVVMLVNGGAATVNVPVLAVSPGVYGALGSDSVMRATLVRQDGSFVSLSNPARRGDTVTAYVTGLGPTTPAVGTNQVPPRGTTATVNGTVVPGLAGGGTTLNYARLTSDLVGVYEVSFVIPANVNTGNSIGFSIGVVPVGASTAQYSNLIYIPIE